MTRLVLLARIYISLTFVLNVISTSLIGAHHFFGKGRKLAYFKPEIVDIATDRKDPSSLILSFPFSNTENLWVWIWVYLLCHLVFDLSFHRNSTGNVGVIVLYVTGQLIDSTITAYPGCRAHSNRWYHADSYPRSQAIEAKSRSPNDIETGQVRSNKIGFCAPTRETDNNTCSFIAHRYPSLKQLRALQDQSHHLPNCY